MTFREVLEQVRARVRETGRVTYRALKREFALTDDYLEDVKAELIEAERVAADEDGKVLVWVGTVSAGETAKRGDDNPKGETGKWRNGETQGEPGQWTPPH